MALASTNGDHYVVASASGASDHIALPPGRWKLKATCADAYAFDLQEAEVDGTNFADCYYDSTTKVSLGSSTAPQSVIAEGGQSFRMNVTTYNSVITLTASKVASVAT